MIIFDIIFILSIHSQFKGSKSETLYYDNMNNAVATGWTFANNEYQNWNNEFESFCPGYGDVQWSKNIKCICIWGENTMYRTLTNFSGYETVKIQVDIGYKKCGVKVHYKYNNNANWILLVQKDTSASGFDFWRRVKNQQSTLASPTGATSVQFKFHVKDSCAISNGIKYNNPSICVDNFYLFGETATPTEDPTINPSAAPTIPPTKAPTTPPSNSPSISPTQPPSKSPSISPTQPPTTNPTLFTQQPTSAPTFLPSLSPSIAPTIPPTVSPSTPPSVVPSNVPTDAPSTTPTLSPSNNPSISPSNDPTEAPTEAPSSNPTSPPSIAPTNSPSFAPIDSPTYSPSESPSLSPTLSPSKTPTAAPTNAPSTVPTMSPSQEPSNAPSNMPSVAPSMSPSKYPTDSPSIAPSFVPSISPSNYPTQSPSIAPTIAPSYSPTPRPTFYTFSHENINSNYVMNDNQFRINNFRFPAAIGHCMHEYFLSTTYIKYECIDNETAVHSIYKDRHCNSKPISTHQYDPLNDEFICNGSNTFIQLELFPNEECAQSQKSTIFIADGICTEYYNGDFYKLYCNGYESNKDENTYSYAWFEYFNDKCSIYGFEEQHVIEEEDECISGDSQNIFDNRVNYLFMEIIDCFAIEYVSVDDTENDEITLTEMAVSGYAVGGLVVVAPLILILIAMLFHKFKTGSDNPEYLSFFKFFGSTGDFYTDAIWSFILYSEGHYLYLWAFICTFGPHLLSIIVGLLYITNWRQNRAKQHIAEYAKEFDTKIIILTLFSGFYATAEIITSHLFHLEVLSLQLTKKQKSRIFNLQILNEVILEDIPCFYIQYLYLTTSGTSIFENELN
eukprot:407760_1